MEPIKINVSVQIGVTPELSSLLAAFSKNAAAPVAAIEKPVEQPEKKEENKPEEAKPAETEAPAIEATKTQEKNEYTEVDVRAAMDKTRRRIEGENYKDNTDSENYKKYHRPLTAMFKNIAAELGSDKPSTLPTPELREQFINRCDELIVGEDGNITINLHF